MHARVHLRSGTSSTVAGWYGLDAIATSVAGGIGREKRFHAGGSLDALANYYPCPHGLLAHAFKLHDRRGTPP